MRPHAEWKVRIQIALTTGPSRSPRRSRISPAALFVNVIARISGGFAPTAFRRCATRCVRTRVFPDPAPAITSTGPSVVRTASRWAGFRSARYCSGEATVGTNGKRIRGANRPFRTCPGTVPGHGSNGHARIGHVQLALMIEGQEGVTWEQWLALADACER